MISINGFVVDTKHFPDGSQMLLNFQEQETRVANIVWQYEGDEELVTLYFMVNHIKDTWFDCDINLYMPYIPNARMDRTKNFYEIFTLKYFCKLINSMGFTCVQVFDPHSNVSEALINKIRIERPGDIIGKVFYKIAQNSCTEAVYFPDDGAMKRYADCFTNYKGKMFFGKKKRDWETGKILGLEIYNANGDLATEEDIKGLHILMVDDIMSYGGTLAYSADKLKELGAEEINAYVSHCEKSVLDEEKGTFIKRLNDGTVKQLYTTNSIFLEVDAHPQIEVLKLPKTNIRFKNGK